MRLSNQDRRTLDAILRSRLAPFFRLDFFRKHLMVVITASIYLSPEAIARIHDGSPEFAFEPLSGQEHQDNNVKLYTREELRVQAPIPVTDLGDKLTDQIIGLIKGVGSDRSSNSQLNQHVTANNKADYFVNHAAMVETSESKTEVKAITATMQKEAQTVATKKALEQTPLYQKLKGGLDFKLDFARIFGKSGDKEPKAKVSRVRYGLILKSVHAKKDLAKAQAANDATLEEDLTYLGSADVVWTIGPIEDKANQKVFNADVDMGYIAPSTAQASANTQSTLDGTNASHPQNEDPQVPEIAERTDKGKTDQNFWANGGIPSPAFKSNVKPSSEKSLQNAATSKGQLGLKIQITQEQGLYQLDRTTPEEKGKKATNEHTFKLPVVGTMSVGRRYGDKMDLVSTSVNDILVKKDLPRLSVHYFEKSKQYVADGSIGSEAQNFEVTFKARTNVKVGDTNQRENAEGYEVGLKQKF